MKRSIEPVSRGRIRLRLLAEADLPMTLAWRNQDHIRKWFVHSDRLTEETHRRWFARYIDRDDDFTFIIEETKDLLKPVGQLSLYNLHYGERRGEYGRLLIGEPDAARRGLGSEATALALDLGFEKLRLLEIETFIKSDNARSLRACRNAGFCDTGEHDGMKRLVIFATNRSQLPAGQQH